MAALEDNTPHPSFLTQGFIAWHDTIYYGKSLQPAQVSDPPKTYNLLTEVGGKESENLGNAVLATNSKLSTVQAAMKKVISIPPRWVQTWKAVQGTVQPHCSWLARHRCAYSSSISFRMILSREQCCIEDCRGAKRWQSIHEFHRQRTINLLSVFSKRNLITTDMQPNPIDAQWPVPVSCATLVAVRPQTSSNCPKTNLVYEGENSRSHLYTWQRLWIWNLTKGSHVIEISLTKKCFLNAPFKRPRRVGFVSCCLNLKVFNPENCMWKSEPRHFCTWWQQPSAQCTLYL